MAKVIAVTLANICLDVQIGVCMCLHPSDILALRQTCKSFQRCTRQRLVWVTALHRVCHDNTLFLPSFPISDMSDLEIEKAAMGPRRWIELCRAFEKQRLNDSGAIVRPRASRIINDSFVTKVNIDSDFFIVPGGRYLVINSHEGISVLDLGYTSSSTDCKLIASVVGMGGKYGGYDPFKVQATPDGMGLTIFSCDELGNNCSLYEIYPQNETPHLTQIAHLDLGPSTRPLVHLLPDMVIFFFNDEVKTVFRIWDYRLNHSISFTVDVVENVYDLKVMTTKTAVIVLREEGILIWAIPPLLPQPPDFSDLNPTHISPLFTIPFPDDIVPHPELIRFNTISSWYSGSSQPLYFDILCQESKVSRFQIILKHDLSAASLHVINISEFTPHDFDKQMFQEYAICEDARVSCYGVSENDEWPVFMGLISGRFANIVSLGGLMSIPDVWLYTFFSCPTSGRFVRVARGDTVDIADSVTVNVLDFF